MTRERVPEYERIIAHDQDIAESRRTPRLLGDDIASSISEDIVNETDRFLNAYEVESGEQLGAILEELDTAVAIDNAPRAKEIRHALEERFSKDIIDNA